MTKRTSRILACSAVLSLVFAMPNGEASADLLTGNPGFEDAGMGGMTDSALWNEFSGGAMGTLSERDSSNPFEGSWAQALVAVGNDMMGASAGINQNSIADVGLPSLQENQLVTADFQWNGNLGDGGVAFGVLRILNGVGAIVADSGLVGLGSTGGAYQLRELSVMVPSFGGGDNDTYAAFLEISVGAGAFDGSIASGFVDAVNVQGSVVPEPASAILLGLGSVGMFVRRRRS